MIKLKMLLWREPIPRDIPQKNSPAGSNWAPKDLSSRTETDFTHDNERYHWESRAR